MMRSSVSERADRFTAARNCSPAAFQVAIWAAAALITPVGELVDDPAALRGADELIGEDQAVRRCHRTSPSTAWQSPVRRLIIGW